METNNSDSLQSDTSTTHSTDISNSTLSNKIPKHCEPIIRFISVFKVVDPNQWLQENCIFVKQYFPTASCFQIQTLLSNCFVYINRTEVKQKIKKL